MMKTQEFSMNLNCGIGMNEFDHRSFLSLQQRERPEKFRPERGN